MTRTYSLNKITFDRGKVAVQVAKLGYGESIIRIDHPRKIEWWLVFGYDCDHDDYSCLLIKKVPVTKIDRGLKRVNGQNEVLDRYAERITEVN